jgi:MFS transporter, PPP family, 3-phenylpropionic acid transporter
MAPPTLACVSRPTLLLRLYFFASFAALGAYSPFFPRWLVARGLDGAALGAVVATIPAMGLVGPPVVGLLADSLGLRGSLLSVACLGSFLAFAFLAAAGLVNHQLVFVEIFATVLVFAAFRAPMFMMADVVAIEGEGERDSSSSYGRTRLWGSVGYLVASVGVGCCLDPQGPAALPAVIALLLFAAMLVAFVIPQRTPAVRLPVTTGKMRSLITSEDFPLFLGIAFGAEFAISSYDLCFSRYLSDLGASSTLIGFAWGLGVVVEILLMIGAAQLLARFRPPTLLAFALFAVALRCALLAVVRALPAVVAVQFLHSPSVCLFWISALSHLKRRASPSTFARAQGLFSAAAAAGSVAGMLTWGALYHRVGGKVTFGLAAAAALLVTPVALRWIRIVHRAPTAGES